MKQIIGAVQGCHYNKITHKDIKPDNILFDSTSVIKIIDFGASQKVDTVINTNTNRGSIYFIAPEILSNAVCDEKCDVWSLGILMHVLLCGGHPWVGSDEECIT
jgi:calcium-dependent protein kinase